MWADAQGILLAALLFVPYLLAPGFVVAWAGNLLGFRSQTGAMRLAISLPTSFAVVPIVVNLLARVVPLRTCSLLLLGFSVLAVLILRSGGFAGGSRLARPLALLVAAWLLLCLLSFPDLQIGHRLWSSVLIYDDGIRAAFIDATLRSGAPPKNPLCYFGQPVPSRYYYYWSTVCALPAALGGLSARAALAASSFWCGLATAAMIPVYLRFFLRVNGRLRQLSMVGIGLLLVTGLDLLPTALTAVVKHAVKADMEWWDSSQVTSWVDALLWAPHHIAGLLACLLGFLLAWCTVADRTAAGREHGRDRHSLAESAAALLVAACAFASAAGLSVYISLAFTLFLLVWLVRLGVRRQLSAALLFALPGALALLLSLPFLGDLRHPAARVADFRTGRPAHLFTTGLRTSGWVKEHVVQPHWWRTPLLLLDASATYALEFGFYLLVLVLVARRLQARRRRMTEAETALCYLLGTTLVLATFVRSEAIRSNDFGMRSILLAQWVLLLWAVPIADALLRRPALALQSRPALKQWLFVTLVLGACASAYEVALLRFAAPLDALAAPSHPPVAWLPGLPDGEANYWIRSTESALNRQLDPGTVVEYNPFNTAALQTLIYAREQLAAASAVDCGAPFGGSGVACESTKLQLRGIFAAGTSAVAPERLDAACRSASIDVLLVQATDPVWRAPDSWVWQRAPLLGNSYMLAFRCGAR